MPDVPPAQRCVGEPAHRDDMTASSELADEGQSCRDLPLCRRPVGGSSPGMGRNDVPEQNRIPKAELGEHSVHDGRRRLRRPGTAQLPFGRERDA
jgi:hypothetical protein